MRQLPPDAASPPLPPDGAMEQDELGDQITCALASLARSHRLALELRHAGFSARHIASVSNCTEKAIQRRVEKARVQLRLSF